MIIQTATVVVGGTNCNAQCPYCISKSTPGCGVDQYEDPDLITFPNFLSLAVRCGVTTMLFTGKGEPALYPDDLFTYMGELHNRKRNGMPLFPFVELQTNGILFDVESGSSTWTPQQLIALRQMGMTTICLSVVHWEYEKNRSVYQPNGKYMDLERLIKTLRNCGFMVRLSCMTLKGYIDTTAELGQMIEFARDNKVKQLTVRNIARPDKPDFAMNDVDRYIHDHALEFEEAHSLEAWLGTHGRQTMALPFGAVVYDVNGQNCGWFNCLTTSETSENLRQIIYFPDGSIRYDWKYEGAVLL